MKPFRPDALSLRRAPGISALAAVATLASALVTACSADNAIVGGSCATGFTECDLACVDTNDDPNNCGECGNVCASGECVDGVCREGRDASRPDGSRDAMTDGSRDGRETEEPANDGGRKDGSKDGTSGDGTATGDGTSGDGTSGDGTTKDVETDRTGDASCAPPFDTTDSCGACGVACSSTDVCAPGDAGTYHCVPLCTPPLTDCGGTCVDTTDDSDNCGRCGKVCPSGFCGASACEGTTQGDVVVIGEDYSSKATVPSSAKILTNAVFLSGTSPLELLSFEHYADPVSVANVKALVNAAASLTGRKVNITVSTTDTDIPTQLTTTAYDVLLVYDQEAAAAGVLGPLGASWATTLSNFTAAGGIVVSLDGAAGTVGEMPAFDTSAGLLAVSAHTFIKTNTALDVVAGGDAVGHGVVGPYAAKPNSVFFTTSESNGGNVVYVVVDPSDAGQAPVVVHKAVP